MRDSRTPEIVDMLDQVFGRVMSDESRWRLQAILIGASIGIPIGMLLVKWL